MEQRRPLIITEVVGQSLERIPQGIVAAAYFIDGKVRFKHAAFYAETGDRVVIKSPSCVH